MLFRKKITRSCSYCVNGTMVQDEQILCIKKGLRTADSSCRKFCYDPCKRVPAKRKALDFSKYSDDDFSL